MGAHLPTPNRSKHSAEGKNTTLRFGASLMQGWPI
jgi:hypothetical protein